MNPNRKRVTLATTISKKPFTTRSVLYDAFVQVVTTSTTLASDGIETDMALNVIHYATKKSQMIYMNKAALIDLRDRINDFIDSN